MLEGAPGLKETIDFLFKTILKVLFSTCLNYIREEWDLMIDN
jgi:hypothetical protein